MSPLTYRLWLLCPGSFHCPHCVLPPNEVLPISAHRLAPGRQKHSKDSGITKRSFLLLLLSSERSASPSCFPSWRAGPRHVATARLHHICCFIALWAACTARSTAVEPSQQTSVRETFPLTWLSVMTEESKPRIKTAHLHVSYFKFACLVFLNPLERGSAGAGCVGFVAVALW